MKNKMSDLRNHLFMALESLADKENPMAIDRAKAIADVAQTLINSATVEVKFLAATGATKGTGFITLDEPTEPLGTPRAARLVGGPK
jgi:hypothetical protein